MQYCLYLLISLIKKIRRRIGQKLQNQYRTVFQKVREHPAFFFITEQASALSV